MTWVAFLKDRPNIEMLEFPSLTRHLSSWVITPLNVCDANCQLDTCIVLIGQLRLFNVEMIFILGDTSSFLLVLINPNQWNGTIPHFPQNNNYFKTTLLRSTLGTWSSWIVWLFSNRQWRCCMVRIIFLKLHMYSAKSMDEFTKCLPIK